MKLKDLKKIHKLENQAFSEKLHMGFKFLADVGETLAQNFAAVRNAKGEPIHETHQADTQKFNALLDKHFCLAGAGIVECVGKNLFLRVQDYTMFIVSKEHSNFSLEIDRLNNIDCDKLDNLIQFVLNA